jgi:hypothetical protein
MTGKSKNTITRLLVDAGKAYGEYQDRVFRDLPCQRIQVDEIWSFTCAKQKNVARSKARSGRRWRYAGGDRCRHEAVPSWLVGGAAANTR